MFFLHQFWWSWISFDRQLPGTTGAQKYVCIIVPSSHTRTPKIPIQKSLEVIKLRRKTVHVQKISFQCEESSTKHKNLHVNDTHHHAES